MSNIINTAETQLRKFLKNAILKAIEKKALEGEVPESFVIERPKDRSFGDYSTNIALVSSKLFKKNPREIASIVVENLDLDGSYFNRPQIAGPGFINFRLNDSFYADAVLDVLNKGDDYGKSDVGQGKKVMVEFVSANPTGPMHIGNARGGALGDSLASVFEYAGYDVCREFYVNDAGNQIEKFADSLEARYLQIYKGEDAVPFPEDGYQGEDIKERAREFADREGNRFVEAESAERRKALIDYALDKNITALEQDLLRYRIKYDHWFLESKLHGKGKEIDQILQRLKDNDMLYEQDNAIWYKSTQYGAVKDDVLVRQNGIPTYFAADIAYHANKFDRGFDRLINVWGADHHGHVARLKGAMDAAGYDGNNLDVVLMQLVRLVKNGETVKVSKRTGKAITLNTLLDEVPLDAARFFFNMREPNTHLEFDMDLAVQQSSENPVYYVQYAHARICSILRKLMNGKEAWDAVNKVDLMLLGEKEEKELILDISLFTEVVLDAVDSLDPSKMTRYAIEVSMMFHKFYNACKVSVEDQNLRNARAALIVAVRTVIKNLLDILKIDAPEIM